MHSIGSRDHANLFPFQNKNTAQDISLYALKGVLFKSVGYM